MKSTAKFVTSAAAVALAAGWNVSSAAAEAPLISFEGLTTESSVEGNATVHPDLAINGIVGDAKVIETEDANFAVYGGPNDGTSAVNNCLEDADGLRVNVDLGAAAVAKGFADEDAKAAKDPMDFDFTFLNGATVNAFSVVMFDFGDFNPDGTTNHKVTLTAKDATDAVVNTFTLAYGSAGGTNPTTSEFGNLLDSSGDACSDLSNGLGAKQSPQNSSTTVDGPGYLKLAVSGSGIAKVELRIQQAGLDPNIGFDSISFTREADINVHPASDPNPLNLGSGGTTPVAIFGSASFDVSQIDVSTLTLNDANVKTVGKSDKTLCSVEDVGSVDTASFDDLGDPDGFDDLVCHFVTADIGDLSEGENLSITVSGELLDGTPFSGTDVVKVVKE